MNCKICGKDLYNNISFVNMFKMDYKIHSKCINKLIINTEDEVIPIESNIVIYDYVFKDLDYESNEEYLWFFYMKDIVKKHLENKDWSMMIFLDNQVYEFLNNFNPYLLINLSNNPILLISLVKTNLFYLYQI
jgi:hypothetical protein